jgi:hypothetical protein
MAKPECIEVLVPVDDPDESIVIDAQNFTGEACSLATKAFEKALGKVESKNIKPEFYKKNEAKRNIKLGN